MRLIAQEIGLFLIALTFLTRLPGPSGLEHSEGRLARSARYFPLVGVIVGLIGGVVYFLCSMLFTPLVSAGLAIMASVMATGALHEDGLADSSDGLGALRDRDRALDIMRDSRIGTFGATALLLSFGLRWASLSALAGNDGLIAMVLAHTISRAVLVPVLMSGHRARTRGLASSIAGGVRAGEVLVALLLAFAVAMIVPVPGLVAIAAAVVVAGMQLAFILRFLGGYTGDGLGAIQQVSEIAVLVALSVALS